MWNDDSKIIDTVYGMEIKPTAKQLKDRQTKLKAALEYLGDKYLLATPVERKDARIQRA